MATEIITTMEDFHRIIEEITGQDPKSVITKLLEDNKPWHYYQSDGDRVLAAVYQLPGRGF